MLRGKESLLFWIFPESWYNLAGIRKKYYCVYGCILYVEYLSKKT